MMPWIFRQLSDRFGVGATFSSLGRIVVWVAVGFVLIARVIPAPVHDQRASSFNQLMMDPDVLEIGADINDLRGFHPRDHDASTFKIGWVGASSIQTRTPDGEVFYPQVIRERVPVIDGRPVQVDMYFLSGLRFWDEYLATLEAISHDVDFLVVTLNPMWLFNDDAITGWSNISPGGAEDLLDKPQTWPLAAGLITPSEAAIGLLGNEFDAIDGHWSYAQSLRLKVEDWTPLDRSTPPVSEAEPSELQTIAAMRNPINFWWAYRNARPTGLSQTGNHAWELNNANPDGPTWNKQVLGWMADAIVDSEIPTLVYLAPIASSSLEDPDVDAALAGIEARLGEYVDDFAADTVSFSPLSLSRELPYLEFRDLIHLFVFEEPVQLLQGRLCSLLERQNVFCEFADLQEAP
jgi:hypothetical protein